jgi:hypothetical protein
MSMLESIKKPDDRPIICTICGDAGTGKTRLAATFPKPIFIRAEDGMQSIPTAERPDAFPLLTRIPKASDIVTTLFDQLIALLKEPHDYQTLVIDSVSALDAIFTAEALERDGRAKTLAQALGGYGAGVQYVSDQHRRVRKAAGALNERRGMNIVFIAHADVETMRLPDQDDYQRYSLRLPAKSLPPYVDDVDMVGFIKLVSVVRGEDGERKRAISTGDRELVVASSVSNISKNRFGITETLDVPEGQNPLYGLVPGLDAKPEHIDAADLIFNSKTEKEEANV